MKKTNRKEQPNHHRNAKKLQATIERITAALKMLVTAGEPFKNISHLAEELAAICKLDRSLLLKKNKSYRQLLDKFLPLLVGGQKETTLYNHDIDPLHPMMIRLNEMERKCATLLNVIDDLSKRRPPAPTARKAPNAETATATSSNIPKTTGPVTEGVEHSYLYEYEITCQLVDRIFEHRRAFQLKDNQLVDVSDFSGIPKVIAESKLITPYTTWKEHRARIN